MFDFDTLDKMLEDINAGSRAAECHGFLCAQICVSGAITDAMLDEYLLANAVVDDLQFVDCRRQIMELGIAISEQMALPDFDLQLMLPDDDESLEQRGIALTEWCQGFLAGLGIAGLGSTEVMTSESKELIDDLYQICRLSTDNLADDPDEYSQTGESDLMELIEYVRMGAIFIYEEFHGSLNNEGEPGVVH